MRGEIKIGVGVEGRLKRELENLKRLYGTKIFKIVAFNDLTYREYLESLGIQFESWPPSNSKKSGVQRFKTGAVRNSLVGKLDYEGFISPLVLKSYAEYMDKHTVLEDGSRRASDDWQKGIPKSSYAKSLLRHVIDFWLEQRGCESRDGLKDALNGVIFNSMGYLLEILKEEEKCHT